MAASAAVIDADEAQKLDVATRALHVADDRGEAPHVDDDEDAAASANERERTPAAVAIAAAAVERIAPLADSDSASQLSAPRPIASPSAEPTIAVTRVRKALFRLRLVLLSIFRFIITLTTSRRRT